MWAVLVATCPSDTPADQEQGWSPWIRPRRTPLLQDRHTKAQLDLQHFSTHLLLSYKSCLKETASWEKRKHGDCGGEHQAVCRKTAPWAALELPTRQWCETWSRRGEEMVKRKQWEDVGASQPESRPESIQNVWRNWRAEWWRGSLQRAGDGHLEELNPSGDLQEHC